jgi:Organic solute transporter Ostalpha
MPIARAGHLPNQRRDSASPLFFHPHQSIQIVSHLRTYTQPDFQRFIIRIVFTVPVFAVTSFFSLLFGKAAVYFEAVRGW